MLILRTRQIGHRTYNVTCDDRYSSQTDGAYVQIGWTMFTVCESDGDVFIDKSENITVSLSVQMSQNDWLQRLQPKGEATLFHDEITVSKGSLKMEHVYLHRLWM